VVSSVIAFFSLSMICFEVISLASSRDLSPQTIPRAGRMLAPFVVSYGPLPTAGGRG
jgi:hypothetical protein